MALDTAKRCLAWLYVERLLPEDITAHVGQYRLDAEPEPRATPRADLERVLCSLDLGRPTGIRNAVMIHVMAFCGLRVSELVGMNANDLSLEQCRVRVRAETSKGRRTRFVDLPLTIREGTEIVKPEVQEVMASWLRPRARACPGLRAEDPLFVTLGPGRYSNTRSRTRRTDSSTRPPGERIRADAVRQILRRLAAEAEVDPRLLTPHRLHHYFGLSSAMAGVPTTALMRAMGHSSPLMTARYSEFADFERRWAFARADVTKDIKLPRG